MSERKKPRKQRRIARRAAKVVAVYTMWTRRPDGYLVRVYAAPPGAMLGPEYLTQSYTVPAAASPIVISYDDLTPGQLAEIERHNRQMRP